MRVLVVDDEPAARRRLVRMLERIEEVEVAGEAGDGEEALARIAELRPDAVLLDIQLPGLDGLEVAARLTAPVAVIFTTAYDQYAVRAFEASAVDYLLKPVEAERLRRALEKARGREARREPSELEALLRRALAREDRLGLPPAPPRITARAGERIEIFDARRIARLRSRDGYVSFTHEGREYLLDETLDALEERLAAWEFLRVGRGELINLGRVKALRRDGEGAVAELSDGQQAAVSRRSLPELKRRLGIQRG